MRILLGVLSCGRPDYLERTLASFSEFMRPRPSAVYIWDDGLATPRESLSAFHDVDMLVEGNRERVGRCAGHARLWQATRWDAFAHLDYLFTIEDDVVLLRPLDLDDLADLLNAEPTLAQLALVRCPWGAEIPYGGYIAQFPDRYERRFTTGVGIDENCEPTYEWIASTVDWTSSPALLPAALPREIDWPTNAGCEHELGPRILERRPDAVSGYWGWGEPWVAHIGIERVEGGYGY